MNVGILGTVPYLFIEMAAKQTGTFDPKHIMPIISENLSKEQCAEIEPFLSWLHANKRTIGHRNYETVYAEYQASFIPCRFCKSSGLTGGKNFLTGEPAKCPKCHGAGKYLPLSPNARRCKGVWANEPCPLENEAMENDDYCAECYSTGEDLMHEQAAEERAEEREFFEPDDPEEPTWLPHWHGNRDSDEPFDDEPPEPDTWLEESDMDSLIGPPSEDF